MIRQKQKEPKVNEKEILHLERVTDGIDEVVSGTKFNSSKDREKLLMGKVFCFEDDALEALSAKQKNVRLKSMQKKRRLTAEQPVWQDDDDDNDRNLVKRLVADTPQWASLQPDTESDVDSDVDDAIRTGGLHVLAASSCLAPGSLQFGRCPNANADSPSQGRLTSVKFHPTAQVVMTASTDSSVRFFQVDGKNNPAIQTVLLDNFPVKSAAFSKHGEEVVVCSIRRYFYVYDLVSGVSHYVQKVKEVKRRGVHKSKNIDYAKQHHTPHCWLPAKTREWVCTMYMNGDVSDATFSSDGDTMYAIGAEGRVGIFDLRSRRCVHTFYDDGCIHGTSIRLSIDSQYLACGSNSGVVNIYNNDTHITTSRSPKPLKSIFNLRTACTCLTFNSTTEILAMASNSEEKAVKLVHLPSFKVFSNFPDPRDTKIRIPTSIDFSTNSGYMTIGNCKGRAVLYRLKHYGGF